MTKPKSDKKLAAKRVPAVQAEKGETEPETMARAMVAPFLRHGILGHAVSSKAFGTLPGDPNFGDFTGAMEGMAKAARGGDLKLATDLLLAQALSLDALFVELARRSTANFGDYPLAAERYARLAFKAQSNSRAAIEALAKLHQPREQTVRHVHVNEGGQAVIADNIHHHGGGSEIAKSNGQPHATDAAGESAALLGHDPQGNGAPSGCDEGPDAGLSRVRNTKVRPKCRSA